MTNTFMEYLCKLPSSPIVEAVMSAVDAIIPGRKAPVYMTDTELADRYYETGDEAAFHTWYVRNKKELDRFAEHVVRYVYANAQQYYGDEYLLPPDMLYEKLCDAVISFSTILNNRVIYYQ